MFLFTSILFAATVIVVAAQTTTTTTTASPNKNVTCVCDSTGGSTKSNNKGTCTITFNSNNDPLAYNGVCECQLPPPNYYLFAKDLLGVYTVSCKTGTTTTSTTATTSKPPTTVAGQTTTEDPIDGSGSGDGSGGSGDDDDGASSTPNSITTTTTPAPDEELVYTGEACNATMALNGNKRKITKYLTWAASIWVILWTIITFIINIIHKESGHHRFIGILEEIAIIVLWIFMGYFTWKPFDKEDYCKITTIILQFVMVLILGFCLFEAIFARSIIKGSSTKNGIIPAFLNYIFPFILAAIPTALTYWKLKDFYNSTGVHCFVATYTDMLWAFVMPNWIVLILTLIFGQLAFLACEQADKDVDLEQLYWSKKICKSLPIFSTWILSTYIILMFAFDQQKFWLFIVYLGLCLFLGPIIFICHTFCYENTATSLWKKTHIPFYRPCPLKPLPPLGPPHEPEKQRPLTPKPDEQQQQPYPNENYPNQSAPPPKDPYSSNNPGNSLYPPQPMQPNQSPINNDPTNSQQFYNWLTDRNPNNVRESENILFRRR